MGNLLFWSKSHLLLLILWNHYAIIYFTIAFLLTTYRVSFRVAVVFYVLAQRWFTLLCLLLVVFKQTVALLAQFNLLCRMQISWAALILNLQINYFLYLMHSMLTWLHLKYIRDLILVATTFCRFQLVHLGLFVVLEILVAGRFSLGYVGNSSVNPTTKFMFLLSNLFELIAIRNCTGQDGNAFWSLHPEHCFGWMTNIRLATIQMIVYNTISVFLRLMPNLARLLILDILDTIKIVIFVSQIYQIFRPLLIYGFSQIWFTFIILRSRGKFDLVLRWAWMVLLWNITMVLLMSLSLLTWRISLTLI